MTITNSELIEQYAELHRTKQYGVSANRYLTHVRACIVDLRARTVLEYGCGRSRLSESLSSADLEWRKYDPALPEFSKRPEGIADLVVCTDVMEHIPVSDVDDVLRHIASFSKSVFFHISTRPANNILPNGQNAHCTVWSPEKWENKLREHFPATKVLHVHPDDSCLLITWNSPVAELIGEIEELRLAPTKRKRKKGFRKFFGL